MVMLYNMSWYSIFSENNLSSLCLKCPRMNFLDNNFCRGVKIMHMHKSRVNAEYSVGLDAFWRKLPF